MKMERLIVRSGLLFEQYTRGPQSVVWDSPLQEVVEAFKGVTASGSKSQESDMISRHDPGLHYSLIAVKIEVDRFRRHRLSRVL